MKSNLDTIAEEIQQYLAAEHFIVFRSMSRSEDEAPTIYWDTDRQPDYKAFLYCALQLGVRLVHFHTREFSQEHREEALDRLGECELGHDEKHDLEHRINELAIYEGLTCAIELSFDFEGRIYFFELRTEWYDEWNDILDELEDATPGEDGQEPFSGYYSNN